MIFLHFIVGEVFVFAQNFVILQHCENSVMENCFSDEDSECNATDCCFYGIDATGGYGQGGAEGYP